MLAHNERCSAQTKNGFVVRAISKLQVFERRPRGMLSAMIRQIAPQFFTTDLPATLTYYKNALGFECLGTWNDPPVYAIVARDEHRIHFRLAAPPTPNPDKYADELLDALTA
jgi:hypothetical protein